MESTIREHIEITPGVCGGQARIAGTRIRVEDIVYWHERGGDTPDDIVARLPHLTLAGVYAALAYYHDHRDEILAEMQRGEQFVEAMRAKQPPSLFQQKVAELRKRHGDDSLPSG